MELCSVLKDPKPLLPWPRAIHYMTAKLEFWQGTNDLLYEVYASS